MNRPRSQVSSQRQLGVLVADDDRDTVATLAAILTDEGHIVHTCYSGEDVMPAVERYKPDVCILDVEMPGRTGYSLAQELGAIRPDRPVLIAISGKWTRKSEQLLALSVGFDRFFLKPADPRELADFLGEIARGSDGPR